MITNGSVLADQTTPWTQFWDMSSGGGRKEPYHYIYIQAPEEDAKVIFYNRFGHNPERVTCTCCGEDYSIGEYKDFYQATGYHRECAWSDDGNTALENPGDEDYQTIDEFCQREDVLVIPSSDIKPSERVGEVPAQGYVYI